MILLFIVLRPLSVKAKLVLNQRPEKPPKPFSTPKIDIELGLEGLILSLLQHQYQDILLFLEAQERFNLSGKYLKYRPKGIRTYHGNYKIWWVPKVSNFYQTSKLYLSIIGKIHFTTYTSIFQCFQKQILSEIEILLLSLYVELYSQTLPRKKFQNT